MGNAVQVNLIKGIKSFRNNISNDALFNAWKNKKYDPLMKIVPWERLPDDMEPAVNALGETFFKSSAFTIAGLPAPVKSELRFDTENPRVVNFLETQSADLVKYVSDSTKEVIRDAVRNTFDRAWTPRDVADSIRSSIGLLPQHAKAVDRYREQLIADKNPRAQELSDKYADRLLDYRAMMIGRTETRMAANKAQLAVWSEAGRQGLMVKAKKVWIVDGNPCSICEPMDGVAVDIDDVWVLDSGDEVEVPTETHPNCYCGMEISFEEGEGEDETSGDSDNEEDEEGE